MRFLMACAIVASVFAFVSSEMENPGIGSRHKRAVSRQKCPEKMSTEECKFYANQVKSTEICQGFNVQGNVIQWFTCGTVVCGDNTELVGENLSKSYPDCCSRCVVIDQSKPSSISGSL